MKKILSVFLAMTLALGVLPLSYAEETVEAPIVEPITETTQEPAAAPVEEATEEPAAAPVEEATEEPAAEPTEEATEEPAATPTEEATEEPAATPTEEAAEAPAAEPTEEATEAPAAEPMEEATEEPAAEPTEEAAEEPAAELTATPDPDAFRTGLVYVSENTQIFTDEACEKVYGILSGKAVAYVLQCVGESGEGFHLSGDHVLKIALNVQGTLAEGYVKYARVNYMTDDQLQAYQAGSHADAVDYQGVKLEGAQMTLAEDADEAPVEESTEVPVEDSNEEPVENSNKVPEPTEAPVEEPAGEPAEGSNKIPEPTEAPVEAPDGELTEAPAEETETETPTENETPEDTELPEETGNSEEPESQGDVTEELVQEDLTTISETGDGLAVMLASTGAFIQPSELEETVAQVIAGGMYHQSAARSMLTQVNALRTGPDAWYWNSTDTEKIMLTGLKPLNYDYALEQIAMRRAAELAIVYDRQHRRPDGSSCFTATYEGIQSYGENIAYGYATVGAMFDGWAEADEPYSGQGHRRNMLMKDFTSIGIGCFYYEGTFYWVQEFGYDPSGMQDSTPEEKNPSGVLPNGLTWEVADGVLTLSGNEKIPSSENNLPWSIYPTTKVVLSNGITGIDGYAFYGYEFQSIEIPASVTEIGTFAFDGVPTLEEIHVDSGNETYKSQDGVLFDREMTKLLYYPAGKTTANYTVPGTVRSIKAYAFFQSKLQRVLIPSNVGSMGNNVFQDCAKLKNVIMESKNCFLWNSYPDTLGIQNQTVITCYEGSTADDFAKENGYQVEYIQNNTPRNVKLTLAANGIQVTWDAVENAARYWIAYKAENGDWTKAGDTDAASYIWAAAESGTYQIRVYCATADGTKITSTYDNTPSITYEASPTPPFPGSEQAPEAVWDASLGKLVTPDDPTYTGFVDFEGGKFYIKNGQQATDFVAPVQIDGIFYAFEHGRVQMENIMTAFEGGLFAFNGGILRTDLTGLAEYNGEKFVFSQGQYQRSANGPYLDPISGKWVYVNEGQFYPITDLITYEGEIFYFIDGILASGYTGIVYDFNGTGLYIASGQHYKITDLVSCSNGEVLYVVDGRFASWYTGVVKDFKGAELNVVNGKVVQ